MGIVANAAAKRVPLVCYVVQHEIEMTPGDQLCWRRILRHYYLPTTSLPQAILRCAKRFCRDKYNRFQLVAKNHFNKCKIRSGYFGYAITSLRGIDNSKLRETCRAFCKADHYNLKTPKLTYEPIKLEDIMSSAKLMPVSHFVYGRSICVGCIWAIFAICTN